MVPVPKRCLFYLIEGKAANKRHNREETKQAFVKKHQKCSIKEYLSFTRCFFGVLQEEEEVSADDRFGFS